MRFFLLLDLATLALLVYCLIDCIQTDSSLVRNLPKPFWLVLIVLVPLVGGIAWLVAGRPEGAAARAGGPSRPPVRGTGSTAHLPPAPLGPDDDPDFLRQMRSIDDEHQRTLEQWERDLRDRERRLRGGEDEPPTDGTPTDGSTPSGGPR